MCEQNQRLTSTWCSAVDEFASSLSAWKDWSGRASDDPLAPRRIEVALQSLDGAYAALQSHISDHGCGTRLTVPLARFRDAENPILRMSWSDGLRQLRPWESRTGGTRPFTEFAGSRAFSTPSVRANAPSASGVYGFFNGREWIYIGETEDIRHRLLLHLGETGTQLKARVPTGFAYESCDSYARIGRQNQLVMEYEPVCNRCPHDGRERTAE